MYCGAGLSGGAGAGAGTGTGAGTGAGAGAGAGGSSCSWPISPNASPTDKVLVLPNASPTDKVLVGAGALIAGELFVAVLVSAGSVALLPIEPMSRLVPIEPMSRLRVGFRPGGALTSPLPMEPMLSILLIRLIGAAVPGASASGALAGFEERPSNSAMVPRMDSLDSGVHKRWVMLWRGHFVFAKLSHKNIAALALGYTEALVWHSGRG